jgi:N4-(beta-N-acetylglucosaminyl)-L-asparaginase
MRQGMSPELACKKTVERIVKKRGAKARDLQVGYIAVNNKGQYGAYALQKGFSYAVRTKAGSRIFNSKSIYL